MQVKFARENDLDFAVRCGGYNAPRASSSEGGIVLDMRRLCEVRVDPKQKLVYVQGGAKAEDVDREAHKYGLACVSPGVNQVGFAGFTLGEGTGYLTGK